MIAFPNLTPEEAAEADREARLTRIIDMVAKLRAFRHYFDVNELRQEAWLYTHEPVRAETIKGHLLDDYRSKNAKRTRGEARLWTDIDRHLSEYVADAYGDLPRKAKPRTHNDSQQEVQVNRAEPGTSGPRRVYWDATPGDADPFANGLDRLEAFSDTDEDGATVNLGGFGFLNTVPLNTLPTYDRTPHKGRYGVPQIFPFRILEHARDLGIISEAQETLLQLLMDGDSGGDLTCRYPEESYGAVQTMVSRALAALRKEPKVQEWARSLGFDPLATKGARWVSEHRHEDGLPGAPAAQRPFACDCSRGEAGYDEHALDRSDPFLKLVSSRATSA